MTYSRGDVLDLNQGQDGTHVPLPLVAEQIGSRSYAEPLLKEQTKGRGEHIGEGVI